MINDKRQEINKNPELKLILLNMTKIGLLNKFLFLFGMYPFNEASRFIYPLIWNITDENYNLIPMKERIKQRKQKIVYFKIFDAKFDANYLKDTLRYFG